MSIAEGFKPSANSVTNYLYTKALYPKIVLNYTVMFESCYKYVSITELIFEKHTSESDNK